MSQTSRIMCGHRRLCDSLLACTMCSPGIHGSALAIANPLTFNVYYVAVILLVALLLAAAAVSVTTLVFKKTERRAIVIRIALWIGIPTVLGLIASLFLPDPSSRQNLATLGAVDPQKFTVYLSAVMPSKRLLVGRTSHGTPFTGYVSQSIAIQRAGRGIPIDALEKGDILDATWSSTGPDYYSASETIIVRAR